MQVNGLTNVIYRDRFEEFVLLRRELGGDVSQMKEEIRSLKQVQHSDSLVIRENEKKLKNLEDSSEECCSRMEDFQKCKENIEQNSAYQRTKRETVKRKEKTKKKLNVKRKLKEKPANRLHERLSTFTGRKKETKEIMSFLVEKNRGIISMIGDPGFGKSTMAVEVAHSLIEVDKITVIFSYLSTTLTMPEIVRLLCIDVGK